MRARVSMCKCVPNRFEFQVVQLGTLVRSRALKGVLRIYTVRDFVPRICFTESTRLQTNTGRVKKVVVPLRP